MFPLEKLDNYYRYLAHYMFDDYFWSNTLEYKQSRIFIYYYCSAMFIKFGAYSKIMFDELYKVYQIALAKEDDNLIFPEFLIGHPNFYFEYIAL